MGTSLNKRHGYSPRLLRVKLRREVVERRGIFSFFLLKKNGRAREDRKEREIRERE